MEEAAKRGVFADSVIANHLEGVAALAAVRGELERAALLPGAAEAARERLETPLEPFEQRLHDETLRRLALTWDDQMSHGRAMSLQSAV